MPRKVNSMTDGVLRLRQEQADDDNEDSHCPSTANRTKRSRASPWRETSKATGTQSLISPTRRTSNELDKERGPGNTIATSGRAQRTLKSGREGVLISESTDHTSQRDGSTEGVCWIKSPILLHFTGVVPVTNTTTRQHRNSDVT